MTLKYHETHYTRKLAQKLGENYMRLEGVTTGDGFSDIIGWDEHGIFTAIEVKKNDEKVTSLQKRFLNKVPKAYVARVWKWEQGTVYAVLFRFKNGEARVWDFDIILGKER